MSSYKQIIAEQLGQLGKAIPSFSDEELYTGVLDTCSGLVSVLLGNLKNVAFNPDGMVELVSCLDGLQDQMNDLSMAAGCVDCLQVETDIVEKLNEKVQTLTFMQAKHREAAERLPELEKKIQELKPEVNSLEQQYQKKADFHKALTEKAEEYSDEKRQALSDENDRLVTEVSKLTEAFQAQEKEVKKKRADIAAIQQQIDNMPDQQQLVAEYDKKEAELKRLKNAEKECSPEKQNELEGKIHDLKKYVNELENAMKDLEAKEKDLLDSKTKIETKKGVFETDFIEKLQNAMDDLKNHMDSHKDALNDLKDSADTLKKSIDECDKIRRNYSFMFDTMEKPLMAIAKATSIDHETLKRYLDVNMSDRIKELKNNIRQELDELGSIIDKCREASSTDQNRLLNKVFKAE